MIVLERNDMSCLMSRLSNEVLTTGLGNGGTRSCRRSISMRYSGCNRSTLVDTACAIFT